MVAVYGFEIKQLLSVILLDTKTLSTSRDFININDFIMICFHDICLISLYIQVVVVVVVVKT